MKHLQILNDKMLTDSITILTKNTFISNPKRTMMNGSSGGKKFGEEIAKKCIGAGCNSTRPFIENINKPTTANVEPKIPVHNNEPAPSSQSTDQKVVESHPCYNNQQKMKEMNKSITPITDKLNNNNSSKITTFEKCISSTQDTKKLPTQDENSNICKTINSSSPLNNVPVFNSLIQQDDIDNKNEDNKSEDTVIIAKPIKIDSDEISAIKKQVEDLQQNNFSNNVSINVTENNTDVRYNKLSDQERQIFDDAVKKGIIEHGQAGKQGKEGLAQLSQKGYELQRYVIPIEQKIINFSIDNNKQDNEIIPVTDSIFVISAKVHPDTEILTPLQSHYTLVEGDPDNVKEVKAFAYLTSSENIGKSVELIQAPTNHKISDTQYFSGKEQPQYAVPIIPPQIISSNDCIKIEDVGEYLENPIIQANIDILNDKVSIYQPILYKPLGITIENIKELNQLDEMLTNTLNTESTVNVLTEDFGNNNDEEVD